jgi:hypothetical protein
MVGLGSLWCQAAGLAAPSHNQMEDEEEPIS